jgi:hypothetical protein
MDAVGAAILARQALVYSQLPPSYQRAMTGGSGASAPAIIGRVGPGVSPAQRMAVHHGLPVPDAAGKPFVADAIVGKGGYHGHHHRGRGGGVQILSPVWQQPYATAPVGVDCGSAAQQAAHEWARFGVQTVYCSAAGELVAVAVALDTARRNVPPVYLGYRTQVVPTAAASRNLGMR